MTGFPLASGFVDIVGHLFEPGQPIEGMRDLHGWAVWFQLSPNVFVMWVAAALCLLVFGSAAGRPGLIPRGWFRNLVESLVLFVRDEIVRPNLGAHGDRFLPLFLSVFFFILFCNLLGLLPYSNTPTGNLSTTGALATVAFVVYHGAGVAEQGLVPYLKSIVPHVPLWLWPLMLIVEVIGHLAKTSALAIRLFANMVGGHATVLGLFGLLLMVGAASFVGGLATACLIVPMVLGIYLLELLVAVIQAFIFTFLLAIFTGMAMHPEH